MNKGKAQQITGTIQFAALALMFLLPWLSNNGIKPLSSYSLNMILEFEFGVMTIGFLIAGLFFIPMALIDSVWLRRISLLLAVLLVWPMSRGFHQPYGWSGVAAFYWLLFVNYSSVFLHSMAFYSRGKLLAEIGLRTMFYVVLFSILSVSFGMPTNVNRWADSDNGLLLGILYFSVLGFFEYKRYFPKIINFLYYLFSGNFRRVPNSKVRFKKGRYRSHVVKYSRAHYWWLILGVGVFLIGFLTPILAATPDVDAPLAIKIALWVFCIPFYLIGIACVLSGPWMMFKYFTARPAWLELNQRALEDDHRLIANGFVPSYTGEDKRQSIEPVITCYQLTAPVNDDEFVHVETLVQQAVTDSILLSESRAGTHFRFESTMPEIENDDKPDGKTYLWHLQLNVMEKRTRSHVQETNSRLSENYYNWSLAFTLPAFRS